MNMSINKKYTVGLIVLVVIIAVGVGAYLALKPKNEQPNNNENNQPQYTVKQACDFFTEADAKKVLGAEVQKKATDSTNRPGAVKGEVDPTTATTCSYAAKDDAAKQLTIIVRSSTPDQAKTDFDSMRIKDAKDLNNYGEEGYEYTIKSASGTEEYGVRVLSGENILIAAGLSSEASKIKDAAKTALDRL